MTCPTCGSDNPNSVVMLAGGLCVDPFHICSPKQPDWRIAPGDTPDCYYSGPKVIRLKEDSK